MCLVPVGNCNNLTEFQIREGSKALDWVGFHVGTLRVCAE